METAAAQVPEGFRPVKRWPLAFKIWGLTTFIVSVAGTALVLLLEFILNRLFHCHLEHRTWQVALAAFCVFGVVNVPLFVSVLRRYPGRFRWK